MELIYSVSSEEGVLGECKCFIHSRDEGFVVSSPDGVRRLDPNVPWEASHRKTTYFVRSLAVNGSGTQVLIADEVSIELYDEKDTLLGRTGTYSGESFPCSGFIERKERVYLDSPDSSCLYEKFSFSFDEEGEEEEELGLLVSTSGMLIAIHYDSDKEVLLEHSRSLDNGIRSRVEVADMARLKDGSYVVATSDGHPEGPIKIYSVALLNSQLSIEPYVSLFPSSKGGSGEENKDVLSITGLHFINPDDSDALLIAMKTESGVGRVEMWELKDTYVSTHKVLSSSGGSSEQSEGSTKGLAIRMWVFTESFSGPSADIVSICSPYSSLVVSGKSSGPSYYIAIAYSDGSIQCLLRHSLQQVESVDLPSLRGGGLSGDESKMLRLNVKISDMSFTPTGSALVVVDTSGQLYLYRMSPISDPGGPHTVNYAVTLLEYCLVSGRDWWDVLICVKPTMVESICDKLNESYQNQSQDTQRCLFGKVMAMKMSLYRLSSSTENKAADVFANLMLNSVAGAFESLLRPTELSENVSTIYKLQVILQNNQKSEWDIDKLVERLKSVHKEFTVDPHILQSFQQLIQWTSTLALHLMASIPEFKQRKGPGYDLINDKKVLTTLRELLLLIRIWGLQRQSCLPTFTRTIDNFDVIAKVFSLITKFNENPNDESILDDCLLLPSQVMIPPLNCRISCRGTLAAPRFPISYEFGVEPSNTQEYPSSTQEPLFIEGTMGTNQSIDIIRYIFLGRNPGTVKGCTRCKGVTLFQGSIKNCPPCSWDKRWLKNCPCGGYWRVKERP